MKITREWAMPNKNTFSINPIKKKIGEVFLFKSVVQSCVACDPFVRHSPFKDKCVYTNDLDPAIEAAAHMDALLYLKTIPDTSCDIVLFDPPYSPRQVSECYKKQGMSVNMQTTQSIYWGLLKTEIARITKQGAIVVTCGWNSGGIGKSSGFEIKEILLVAHGGWHNDTIVTIECKGSL
jgi:hypothetical protein